MGTTSVKDLLKQKKETKKALAKTLGFAGGKPLVVIVVEGEIAADVQAEIGAILEAAGHIEACVAVLNDGEPIVKGKMSNVIEVPYNRENRRQVMEAADMAITFDFNDVEEMMLNGVVPISGARKEVSDYDANSEKGNSFIYKTPNRWAVFAALVRALETHKFPYDWANIVRVGVKSVEA